MRQGSGKSQQPATLSAWEIGEQEKLVQEERGEGKEKLASFLIIGIVPDFIVRAAYCIIVLLLLSLLRNYNKPFKRQAKSFNTILSVLL